MTKEDLIEYKKKLSELTEKEQKMRDNYLRQLATGELKGAITGYPSIDKTWLKYYDEKQILADMPKCTIYRYMLNKNKKHLNDECLIYFGKRITYKEFDKLIDKCAASFIQSNIKNGDIVTICMPNTPEAVISVYALNKIGAIANMIHPLSSQNEIKNYLNEVDSKMIITMDIAYDNVLKIMNNTNLQRIVTVEASNSMPWYIKMIYPFTKNKVKLNKNNKMVNWNEFLKEGKKTKVIEYPYEENKTSIILHTGGTTGTPKGVELTNDNFNCMVEQFILNADKFQRGDRLLAIMPVFHGFGLCSSIHLPLSVGVSVNLIPKLDLKKLGFLFKKYHINHIIGVPTFFKALLKCDELKNEDLSYVKYVVSGGDIVKDSLENDINDFFKQHNSQAKICKGYGLSEAVAGVTFACDDYNKVGSVGIPMVQTNVKIVEPNTDDELNVGEIGEICVYGQTVMKKYYHNEEETNNTIIDGWLHTGDLGYYDGDVLYFAQRKGNLIISSGVNVYPINIEQIIETHEAVASCAVIGIYHPYKIQVPKAFITLKPGYESSQEIKQEIEDLCKKNLNIYSIPYSYEFREKLPETLLGKISHQRLQEEEKVKVYSKNR